METEPEALDCRPWESGPLSFLARVNIVPFRSTTLSGPQPSSHGRECSYSFRPRTNEFPMALAIPANALGLIVSGDVDGYTIYTDMKGRKVVFPQAPPKEPPSPLQISHRYRFATAQAAWTALTVQEKATLELCTHRASLAMTGQNLYIAIALKANPDLVATLERQTDLTLPAIPYVHYPP